MKNLIQFIKEDISTDELSEYNEKTVFYHVSKEEITKLNDFPMFCFYDIEEAYALRDNFVADTREPVYIYKFNVTGKVLTFEESEEFADEDITIDLISNPNENELRSLVKDIQDNIGDNNIVGVTILDYSQKNYQDDAFSILLFNPIKCVKNFKKWKVSKR